MAKNKLVIVESPSKAKTVEKYLGKGYKVAASMGHIRDLPKSKLGVDVEHGFEPVYVEDPKKEEVIKSLKSAAKSASIVYLAGDPDREGEAISWHLANILGIDDTKPVRVTFNEITEQGVKEGMAHPRPIDLDLVNAQQSRRILDRIVGYKLSPFLWRKVKRGLSAGRVQSVAVKMIVDREREINAFVPEEYWSVEAKFTAPPSRKQFDASFYSMDGKKLKIKTRAGADTVVERSKNAQFTVVSVKNSKRKRSPAPPFTTSTMQQEASRKMGFQTQRTMRAAQQLYEGVDVEGMGAVGLITYMRTDSLRISDTARAAASEYIERSYGKEYLPDKPQVYKTKKNVQDAHEAIRPSTPSITPAQVKDSLTPDQYKLYKLIWERFIASQMANEILDTVAVEIEGDGLRYKASGFTVNFKGFAVLYEESKEEGEKELPTLKQGDKLSLKAVEGKQHFTQPPARYTEGSFIKALEENGIGRPSTYAPTISTIVNRNYVERDGKILKPTPLGEVVTDLLADHFKKIVDLSFTAEMETDLDKVETGEQDWHSTLGDFYEDFSTTLTTAEKDLEGKYFKVPAEETDEVCELCGKPMAIKFGRFGRFLACTGFPDCKNAKRLVKPTGGVCPKCGKKIIQNKSKKGRTFYGCEGYPDCDFVTWDKPVEKKCPNCNDGTTMFEKKGHYFCAKCGYDEVKPKN